MKYFIVDAFAERVFEGNPAAVCILDAWLDPELMQRIAVENNLSETAFAVKEGEHYRLRWFTPGGEVDLCGHATLATAFVICNYVEDAREIVFETMSGRLTVARQGDLYELDFPARMPSPVEVTPELVAAIGATPVEGYLERDYMFVLENEEAVRDLKPDLTAMEALPGGIGVLVTAKGSGCDFVSRAFFPKLKVNEDPVCGSAHCNFIPFWSERLNKREMVALQLSARGGVLYCKHCGDRVKIAGKAALYAIGEFFLPADQR